MTRTRVPSGNDAPPAAPRVPPLLVDREPRDDAGVQRSLQVLSRNLRFIGAGVFGSAVVQYALFFGMARVLGVQQYGAFSLALTVGMLATPVCNLGTSVGLVHACTRDPERLPAFLGAGLVWRVLLTVPVFVLAHAACRLLGYDADVLWLLLPLFVASIADGAGMLASSVFQAWEQMSYSAGIALLRSALRCLALAGVLLTGGGARELALYYAAAAVLAAIPPWWPILRRTAIDWHPRHWLPVLRQSAPFAVGVLSVLALGQVDVALLGWLAGTEEVGAYHAATRFLVLALLVPQVITTAVSPLAYKLGLHGPAAVARLYQVDATAVGALGVFTALAMALHGNTLVAVALGADYAASAPLAHALAPVVFLRFLAAPLDNAMRAAGRQRTWGFACVAAVVVTIAMACLLIPRLGALGAIAACVTAQLGYVLFQAAVLGHAGMALEWRSVYGRWAWITAGVATGAWALHAGLLPPALRWALLPCAALAFAAGAVRRPTTAERALLRRLRSPRAKSGFQAPTAPR